MFDKLVDLLVQCIDLFRFWTVAKQWDCTIITRFGKFQREVNPGIHLILPFKMEENLHVHRLPRAHKTETQSLETADGNHVVASVSVFFDIFNGKKFLLNSDGHEALVDNFTYGAISTFARRSTWAEMKSPAFSNEVRRLVAQGCKPYGLRIINIEVIDLARCRSIRLLQPKGEKV